MKPPAFRGYTVSRPLAGGGMTDLYVAHDDHQQRVVLRTPKEEYLKDRDFLKAFFRGARIHAQIEHPHIVRLLQVARHARPPFLVLEYVEGQNLRNLIVNQAPLLLDHPLTLARQAAAALNGVHRAGYIHLDVKPENFLVETDAYLRLIDFDLARKAPTKPEKLKKLPGTRNYLAPETLTRNLVDERSDIFGFGITCYELLTLRKPFPGETPEEMLRAQADPRIEPLPVARFREGVPASLESVILKCLAKAPEARYPSMSLIQRDLEAIT